MYTRRCLAIWMRKYDLIQLKRSLLERKNIFLRTVTKRRFLERWIFLYRRKCSLQNKGALLCRNKSIDLLSRALYALRSYKDLKIRGKHIRIATQARYNQSILLKCMNAWRKKAPEMHLKNELCNELSNDYQTRLLGKVFKAFRLNAKYRNERRDTDQGMAKAVQEITIRKFFRGWRSLVGKRMGLLMLAETMQRL